VVLSVRQLVATSKCGRHNILNILFLSSVDLKHLIEHPEQLDKETLHKLREYVAVAPYHQVARLLYLQNLFLLHDASFGDELRRAALFIPNRKVLFDMVEGNNYEVRQAPVVAQEAVSTTETADRTQSLIDSFLATTIETGVERNRKLTTADATTDYAAFLLTMDDIEPETAEPDTRIDSYLDRGGERIVLQENPEYTPDLSDSSVMGAEEEYFTETLAKIYIKQGNYDKAIEIITRLNLNYPKKSSYFADQLRFLRKLQIINNKTK
jgi:tetratricopeptide (TPR) repeat protein